jgi:hypothetical protein
VVDLSLVKPLSILRRKGLDFRGFLFLVEVRYRQEKYRLFNRYCVIVDEMEPLPCPVIHPGHAVLGGIIRLIVTPVDQISFRSCKKRRRKEPKKESIIG